MVGGVQSNNVENWFLALQEEMTASLKKGDHIPHPVGKGDDKEVNWWNMLETYLPHRYAVYSKVFIADYHGNLSQEVDLVLCDRQYSPLVFHSKSRQFIPAEAVYAVFEVKPEIDRDTVLYAADKAQSVRTLKRTTSPIVHAGGTYDEPREPGPILAGLLTTRCGWKDLGRSFNDAIGDQPARGRLDIGCALTYAGWEIVYADGRTHVDISEKGHALVFFFIRLQSRLRDLGTAPAIDWSKWGQFLYK